MHFFTSSSLVVALGALAIAAPSSTFVEKDHYLKNFAPAVVQRLADFSSEHNNDLTMAQIAYISKATTAISTFNTDDFDSLRDEAKAIFNPADARFILTGDTAATKFRREEDNLMSKRTTCSCSTDSDWCDNDTFCAGGTGCATLPTGCGTFDGYECDGLCRGN
jgi:hypothetical protein